MKRIYIKLASLTHARSSKDPDVDCFRFAHPAEATLGPWGFEAWMAAVLARVDGAWAAFMEAWAAAFWVPGVLFGGLGGLWAPTLRGDTPSCPWHPP